MSKEKIKKMKYGCTLDQLDERDIMTRGTLELVIII